MLNFNFLSIGGRGEVVDLEGFLRRGGVWFVVALYSFFPTLDLLQVRFYFVTSGFS